SRGAATGQLHRGQSRGSARPRVSPQPGGVHHDRPSEGAPGDRALRHQQPRPDRGRLRGRARRLPRLPAGQRPLHDVDVPGEPTQALDINDRGQVVGGTITLAAGRLSGFLLDRGVYARIDFPGALATNALDINNRGQIAGIYADADRTTHAFLRDQDGVYTTIDVQGASVTFPFGINNRGHVVGSHMDANQVRHGFLLKDGALTT